MKRFTCTVEDRAIEKCIALSGWSHCGPVIRKRVLWYPFEDDFRTIYFTAANRRSACKELDKLNIPARDLSDGQTVK